MQQALFIAGLPPQPALTLRCSLVIDEATHYEEGTKQMWLDTDLRLLRSQNFLFNGRGVIDWIVL